MSPWAYLIVIDSEAIVQAFQLRQQATQEALEALEELIQEINQAERERAEKNLKPAAFAVYWLLNREGIAKSEEIARELETTFDEYPHWRVSTAQERDVRRALYRVLLLERAEAQREGRAVKETDELTAIVEQIINVAARAGDDL